MTFKISITGIDCNNIDYVNPLVRFLVSGLGCNVVDQDLISCWLTTEDLTDDHLRTIRKIIENDCVVRMSS